MHAWCWALVDMVAMLILCMVKECMMSSLNDSIAMFHATSLAAIIVNTYVLNFSRFLNISGTMSCFNEQEHNHHDDEHGRVPACNAAHGQDVPRGENAIFECNLQVEQVSRWQYMWDFRGASSGEFRNFKNFLNDFHVHDEHEMCAFLPTFLTRCYSCDTAPVWGFMLHAWTFVLTWYHSCNKENLVFQKTVYVVGVDVICNMKQRSWTQSWLCEIVCADIVGSRIN